MTTSTSTDPTGGLTATGRTAFLRKDGAHLKPGVRKRIADMTPDEMKRKGSWACVSTDAAASCRRSRTRRDGRRASR